MKLVFTVVAAAAGLSLASAISDRNDTKVFGDNHANPFLVNATVVSPCPNRVPGYVPLLFRTSLACLAGPHCRQGFPSAGAPATPVGVRAVWVETFSQRLHGAAKLLRTKGFKFRLGASHPTVACGV